MAKKPFDRVARLPVSRRGFMSAALKFSAAFSISGLININELFASKLNHLKFHSDVYVWFQGGRVKKLTAGDGIYYQSCINPEGTYVVFTGNSSDVSRIWRADVITGEIVGLTSPEHGARHPAFSWENDSIVFASDRASGQAPEQIEDLDSSGLPPEGLTVNIFVMGRDGKDVRQITSGPYQDQRPCFSPDGKTIAFISNRSGPPFTLWAVAVDGNNQPRPLTEAVAMDGSRQGALSEQGLVYRPWYAVDGKKIFVFADVNGRHRICSIPAEGGKITPLTNDDVGMSHGPFSDPNGKSLLMHSNRDGTFGIWELPLDGDTPRRLNPPGIKMPSHATRAGNGTIAFDVVKFKD
ncbi:MAG: PD40 domain-containing protein [Deltaproteobacteria bacterium]|nr:PD40 domain-containing protein [Deltaproteobacteria bacterium]